MLYEIVSGASTLAVLPCAGCSPQLAALRLAYDWSLRVPTPVVLWRLTFGPISAFPVCSLCRGAALPLT